MKPYLFLDVDGVLNERVPGTFHEYVVTVETARLPDSPFINRFSGETVDLTIRFAGYLDEWLRELGEHFELAWATTWENAANEYLAPLLGLPELPVVEHSKTPAKFGWIKNGDSAAWKWASIEPFAGDRALAWVDDQAWSYAHVPDLRDDLPTLVIAPQNGLTREHVDELLAFASALGY